MAEEKIKNTPEEKVQKEKKIDAEKKVKTGEKKTEKKIEPVKKDLAVANAYALRISPKYAFSICKVIKGKDPEKAIERLEEALKGKRAIPMSSREVAHQKGKGMAGGKFPKKACSEIISVIKQIEANASVAGIENPIITLAKADKASAPFRRGGRKGKRTHIHLEVKDKTKLTRKKK